MDNKEKMKPLALAVRISGGNWLTWEYSPLNNHFHYSTALEFSGDRQLKVFKANSKIHLQWIAAWARDLPTFTTQVLCCTDSGHCLWQRALTASEPAPGQVRGASPAPCMALGGSGPFQLLLYSKCLPLLPNLPCSPRQKAWECLKDP